MSNQVAIRVFTDPTCPFAYSAEPSRWRLKWLYGDQLEWHSTMVVVAESAAAIQKKNFTPELQAKILRKLRDKHGMPINAEERPQVATSFMACKAYTALRENKQSLADCFLRKVRIASMSGELVDDIEVVLNVAESVGIKSEELKEWFDQDSTEQTIRNDMKEARQPSERALAMKNKISANEDGFRYSTPSYQFSSAGSIVFELPGFWPTAAYEAVIPNIAPNLQKRDDPASAQEVLEWSNEPLSTIEVATLTTKPVEETRLSLNKIAVINPVGQDGFWSLK